MSFLTKAHILVRDLRRRKTRKHTVSVIRGSVRQPSRTVILVVGVVVVVVVGARHLVVVVVVDGGRRKN